MRGQVNFLSLGLANGMKMWKGNGNTTTLLFSLKGLEILHQGKRGQVKTIVMEHFSSILFHESGPANKQYTNHSYAIRKVQEINLELDMTGIHQVWAYADDVNLIGYDIRTIE